MDRVTRRPKCGKRMVPVVTISGRTELPSLSVSSNYLIAQPRPQSEAFSVRP